MPTKRHINKRRPGARDRLLTLAQQRGVLRPRDLEPHGLSRETLRRLRRGSSNAGGGGATAPPPKPPGTARWAPRPARSCRPSAPLSPPPAASTSRPPASPPP